MSSPAESTPPTPPAWPVLNLRERRVLGVLVEKAKTTPDVYPMSLNALTTGCNQKSNRDPVLNLSDAEVEEVLAACQKKGLVIKVTGGRVERWRQQLYEAWHVGKVELAVVTELLLRGPQTEGELRAHASRMEPIADVDALRAVVRTLAERKLVVRLGEEGRRGSMITHGFHEPRDLERLRATVGQGGSEEEPAPTVAGTPARAANSALADLQAEVAALRADVTQLQALVANLSEQLQELQTKPS